MSIHPIRPDNNGYPPHLTAISWQQRLDLSYSEKEVVDVARDFLACFPPNQIYALPERCRPPGKLFADDVAAYAFELVRHECSTPDTAELVHRLARFFSHAATRLAQVSALRHYSATQSLPGQQSA